MFGFCENKAQKEVPAPVLVSESTIESYPFGALQSVDSLDKAYIMGKFDPEQHPDFVIIDPQYADRDDRMMRKDAYDAFIRMAEDAKKDSIILIIKSAVRNFDYQKGIWERKWTGETLLEGQINASTIESPEKRAREILKWSSMPGSSRHHWGTDIDLNAFNNGYFENGQGLKEFEWLQSNAINYGYGLPYTAKDSLRPNGYNMEKWHWSYLPIAIPLVRKAKDLITNEDIKGFLGDSTTEQIDMLNHYILGINPELK